MPIAFTSIRVLLVLTLAALTGCFSLGRDSPVQRHYVLGGGQSLSSESQVQDLDGIAVGLREITVAEYLESPLIVVRRGPHQVTYSEFNRWAEEPGGGVSRAIAGYLASRASFDRIDRAPWPIRREHDYVIQIELLRFEGIAPEALDAAEGGAHVVAEWEIIAQTDGAVAARGTTDYRAPSWQVGDYESLVTSLDAGLRELTDDLIAGLRAAASQ